MTLIVSWLLTLLPVTVMAQTASPHIFVIAMENKDAKDIYGNVEEAPYINEELLRLGSHATNFVDELLLSTPSEPHYILMEAGTAKFPDWQPDSNDDPSAANSTASKDHLVAQIEAHAPALSWMAYQEGIGAATDACPVKRKGRYAPKHNPFVFFQDVSGNPPRRDNAKCAAHMRDTRSLTADLTSNQVANYVFITPNLCHDMHDKCGARSAIRNGDDWLRTAIPPLQAWIDKNGGVIFIVWDEGKDSETLPFIALGASIKAGYASSAEISHRSLIKTVETMLGLPPLPAVTTAADLSDMFK